MKKNDYKILNNKEYIEKVDPSNMHATLISFGQQCQEAIEIGITADSISVPSDVSNLMICGLGGSAIGGDILRSYLIDELSIPIQVNRDYSLPQYISTSSLLFILSYSGNTEEVLRIFEEGTERNIPIVCITSGGLLADRAVEMEKCLIRIPQGYPPRTALGYLFFPMLITLCKAGLIRGKENDMEETASLLNRKAEEYSCRVPYDRNNAKTKTN